MLALLMETQIWCLPVASVGRAQQRNHGLCQHLCLGISCPALALMPNNLVSTFMALAPFELLSWC